MDLVRLGGFGLALVFASAAFLKARRFATFSEGLRFAPPHLRRLLAKTVLATEATLALALVVAPHRVAVYGAVLVFLLGATGYVAGRLIVFDDPRCGCWGGDVRSTAEGLLPTRILAPAGMAARNAVLFVAAWLLLRLTSGRDDLTPSELVLVCSIVPLIVIGGVVASIVARRRCLRWPQHPYERLLAPRLRPLVARSWYMNGALPLRPPGAPTCGTERSSTD